MLELFRIFLFSFFVTTAVYAAPSWYILLKIGDLVNKYEDDHSVYFRTIEPNCELAHKKVRDMAYNSYPDKIDLPMTPIIIYKDQDTGECGVVLEIRKEHLRNPKFNRISIKEFKFINGTMFYLEIAGERYLSEHSSVCYSRYKKNVGVNTLDFLFCFDSFDLKITNMKGIYSKQTRQWIDL